MTEPTPIAIEHTNHCELLKYLIFLINNYLERPLVYLHQSSDEYVRFIPRNLDKDNPFILSSIKPILKTGSPFLLPENRDRLIKRSVYLEFFYDYSELSLRLVVKSKEEADLIRIVEEINKFKKIFIDSSIPSNPSYYHIHKEKIPLLNNSGNDSKIELKNKFDIHVPRFLKMLDCILNIKDSFN